MVTQVAVADAQPGGHVTGRNGVDAFLVKQVPRRFQNLLLGRHPAKINYLGHLF
jgi:hypothetical protein